MTVALSGITHLTADDVRGWAQSEGRQIFLGEVLDETNSTTMGVGFARYAPGESNHWVVTYDEVLVITRGEYRVSAADGRSVAAQPGEIIFLNKGTEVTYSAGDAGAEVVYITYPHWMHAQLESEHAHFMETFHPMNGTPPRFGDGPDPELVAMMKRIWDPLERGQSSDYQPFFDALADDVVLELPIGVARGKRAVIGYFVHAAETLEFRPFERPIEYYGDGNRVVTISTETFTVNASGATHRAEWAWVFDIEDGLITRIRVMQDLGGVADLVRAALAKAQA
jgi:ethanolamine utilization protein EutQ